MKIALDKLVFDPTYYPRNSVDWQQAHRYAEAMQVIAKDPTARRFPPIDVAAIGDGTFRVLDGWHRCDAAKRCGYTEIEAQVTKAQSLQEQFLVAIKANLTHGRGLTNQERTAIACRLQSADFRWSLGRISTLLGMKKSSLHTMLHKRTGNVNGFPNLGKGIPVPPIAKAPFTGAIARGTFTEEAVAGQRAMAARDQRQVFQQVRDLMNCGAVDLDSPIVCTLLSEIATWLRAHSAEVRAGVIAKAS
jgi:hypothetical protein